MSCKKKQTFRSETSALFSLYIFFSGFSQNKRRNPLILLATLDSVAVFKPPIVQRVAKSYFPTATGYLTPAGWQCNERTFCPPTIKLFAI